MDGKQMQIDVMKWFKIGKRYNFSTKSMFTHNYRNRFDMNKTTTNILMTQIRAEQKLYASKHQPALTSHRVEHCGKRVFQEILYRPSLSPSKKENSANNANPKLNSQRGTRMLMETSHLPQERSRSGKKQFNQSFKRTLLQRVSTEKECKLGRKRFDHSPSHQHLRTSFNFNWN